MKSLKNASFDLKEQREMIECSGSSERVFFYANRF